MAPTFNLHQPQNAAGYLEGTNRYIDYLLVKQSEYFRLTNNNKHNKRHGEDLRRVNRFKYLGRLLSYDDSDTPAIRHNLKRARAAWGRLSAIIAKEEIPPAVAGMFYQAVVAAVLLYGSKSWVISVFDLCALDGFHVEAARCLTRMWPKKRGDSWV